MAEHVRNIRMEPAEGGFLLQWDERIESADKLEHWPFKDRQQVFTSEEGAAALAKLAALGELSRKDSSGSGHRIDKMKVTVEQ